MARVTRAVTRAATRKRMDTRVAKDTTVSTATSLDTRQDMARVEKRYGDWMDYIHCVIVTESIQCGVILRKQALLTISLNK